MELNNSDTNFENTALAEKLLNDFEKNISYLTNFDLWYRISKFFKKNIDLISYESKKKDYIYYIDKCWVETNICFYKAKDKTDSSQWIIFEMIIWNKKDIMYFSDSKIYNIEENKWGVVISSQIIENEYNIFNTLVFLENEIKYVTNKSIRYKNNLREKWVLNKYVPQNSLEKFKKEFEQNFLKLA